MDNFIRLNKIKTRKKIYYIAALIMMALFVTTLLPMMPIVESAPDDDFGDAPDPTYPTLLASSGASHILGSGLFLGATVDSELDGQPTPGADGDDTNGVPDDEDGVIFDTPLVQGTVAQIRVTASMAGSLDAWMDFGADGSWAEPGDQIFISQPLVAGSNTLTFGVPASTAVGTTYLRFRLSTAGSLPPTGQASDGEVEDYAMNVSPLTGSTPCASVTYESSDPTTGGNWVGTYGSYAHILPNAPQIRTEVPIGNYSTPIGGIGDLPNPPYDWTSNQYNALLAGLHRSNPPYYDEYVSLDPPVTYFVNGSRYYPPPPDPRALRNLESGTTYYRAACWFDSSKITSRLTLPAGTYSLSLYILDYDSTIRREDIKVSLSSDSLVTDTKSVGVDFSGGFYENFFVYIDENPSDTVIIEITLTTGPNVVVSGVFLSSTSSTPTVTGQDEIRWESEDTTTQGNWIGTYGDIGYIKCAWDVPTTGAPYSPWNIAHDHSSGITYDATTSQYAWTSKNTQITFVQYPVFEWAWDVWHSSQTDPREVYFTLNLPDTGNGPGWRLTTWDCGGERCQPVHGFMNFTLTFHGGGSYNLSLYAYDYELTSRASQQYRIFDASGTILLASSTISGAAFDNGVYEIFEVVVPPGGCTIIVQVYNDQGHPNPNLNVILSGIFVDKTPEDFGDAPDSYQTVYTSDGARHVIVPGLLLGSNIDSESDGQPTALADGDDIAGIDDEDGVTMPSILIPGETHSIPITITGSGDLDAWIDWNDDGTWQHPGEHLWSGTSQAVTGATTSISVIVPSSATGGVDGFTYARFRINSTGGLSPTGVAKNGEVEDYRVEIAELDYGDAPDSYQTVYTSDGARHVIVPGLLLGSNIDSESDGQPTALADGDDLGGIDDEDGVTNIPLFLPGTTQSIQVDITGTGYLDGWIDWNQNGDWNDAGEHVIVALSATGTINPSIVVPPGAVGGTTFARFRINSTSLSSPIGLSDDGEVEDYQVMVAGIDYGDAPDPTYPTLFTSNGARHVIDDIWMGANIDAETDGQPNLAADGDDINGVPDDEDGVTFPSLPYIAGSTGYVSVTVSGAMSPADPAYLHAWIDWNQDGDWGDPLENIIPSQIITASGPYNYGFLVPGFAKVGNTYARFRLDDQDLRDPTGQADNGEVEDYLVDPAVARFPPRSPFPVGGFLIPVNVIAILAPYLALMGIIGMIPIIFVLRKRPKT